MKIQTDTNTGELWLKGQIDVDGYNEIVFNDKQFEFFNSKARHNLISGGLSSGKTLSFVIKFILFSQWFPGSRSLIGRKNKENAQSTFMKDFQELVPANAYEFKVGEGKIIWPNGSTGEFWGLDMLVSGDDTGKSSQKLKSHNFHFAFLDQLEEITQEMYDNTVSRTRSKMCKHQDKDFRKYIKKGSEQIIFEECTICGKLSFNQVNATTNPANFWAHEFFKGRPHPNSHLVETSMLDNKALSEAYVQDMLTRPKKWVDRYVYGKWENWGDAEKLVFLEDHIKQQRLQEKQPLRTFNGVNIYAEPQRHLYQIGHDPSSGANDPCATVVVDKQTGETVATFTGFVPMEKQAETVEMLARMYSIVEPPLVIPEANGVGAAFIDHLKVRYDKIYIRETYNQRENKRTNKLGWNTSVSSKALLIEHTKMLFDRQFPKIRNKDINDEFMRFEYSNEAAKRGAGAKAGSHDDMVMATLLAYYDIQPPTKQETVLTKQLQSNTTQKKNYQYV